MKKKYILPRDFTITGITTSSSNKPGKKCNEGLQNRSLAIRFN